MKQRLLFTALSLFLAYQAAAQCANPANIYTGTHNGQTYEVVKEKKTWANAAQCAVQRGGHLVEINDYAEQQAVYAMINTGAGITWNYTIVASGGGIGYVWIGATDKQAEGTWIWDGNNDGTGSNFWSGQGKNGSGNGFPVSGAYHNWGGIGNGLAQEPDNFNNSQHCGAIGLSGWPVATTLLGRVSEWNDLGCDNELYYVIEYPATNRIRTQATQHQIQLYPNPAAGNIRLSAPTPLTKADFYDAGGRLVWSQLLPGTHTAELATDRLPAGVYLLKTYSGEHFENHRLVIGNR